MIYQQINQFLRQQTSFNSGTKMEEKEKHSIIAKIRLIRKIDFHLTTVKRK